MFHAVSNQRYLRLSRHVTHIAEIGNAYKARKLEGKGQATRETVA
jgi:hypothetical protein